MAGDSNALLRVIRELSFARDLQSVTAIVRSAARRLTGADGATFVLRDGGDCLYIDEEAIAPLWKGRRFPLDQCISGWVMLHGEPAIIPDVYADPRVPHDAYRPTFVKGLAMVPVRRDEPLAAIGLYWAEHHATTAEELETALSIADAAALAFANVRLYRDLDDALARERQARLAAEEANRVKDEFLATLSHELRTPLNVISGWVWQLKHAPPSRLAQAIDVIERNTALQVRLVDDLLDAAKASTGKLQLRTELLDLGALCRTVVEVARPGAQAKGIRLDVECSAGTAIYGDSDRLQQVLWNVLGNAIKFTSQGGHVRVRVMRTGTRLQVSIADDGAGIEPEFLPHVFDRFRQQDQSSSRRHGGLGLGLTIVRQIVELHGGSVEARSGGPGQGTTIRIEFPVPVLMDEPGGWLRRPAEPVSPATRLDGYRVLVVDDEPQACEAVRHILEQHGATVMAATSAVEAVRLAREGHPTLVLTDIAMPEADGYALLRMIRGLTDLSGVPVVALSAHPAHQEEERTRAAGFQLYLEKPIAPDELAARLLAVGNGQADAH